VVVALIVGLFVTVAAAYIPARRASRIPPVAAMRAEVALPQRSLRNRVIIGLVLLVAGVISLIIGVGQPGAKGATYVGAGSALLLFTVIVLSPVIASPVIGFLGFPIRRRGIAGSIAVNNAQRNRRRTASTASALMIGLALVGAMSILGSSTKASTSASVEGVLRADFIVTSTTFRGFSPVVAEDVKAVPGVGVVSPIRSAPGQINERVEVLAGIDPETVSQVLALDFKQGSVSGAKDGFIVDDETFTSNSLSLGQSIGVLFADGNTLKLPVTGTFARDGLLSGYVTSNANLVKAGQPDQDSAVYATLEEGADPVTVKTGIDNALADLPTVVVKDQSEYKASVVGQVDQILAIIYALLGLAIIISILGIVNTLALSVVERTREIGLLRAVGMSRKQMKSSIRWESTVIAVFGALLGLGLGVIFGVSLQMVLRNEGIQLLSIPWGQLIAFLIVSALVGVLAALWPARRASRLNVLDAISSE
jgi:putative ABC transport system permease protein